MNNLKIKMNKLRMKFKKWFYRLERIITKPEMRILPGQVAFFTFMSLIPTITMTVFVASIFTVSLEDAVTFLMSKFPEAVSDILIPYFAESKFNIGTGISVLTGFYLASNGVHSIIVTSNTLYGIDESNYFRRRIKALFITLTLILLFILILFIVTFGNNILLLIFSYGILENIQSYVYTLFNLLKWPFAILMIFLIIRTIYILTPDIKINHNSVNFGALFATVSISIVTAIYSYYVTNIANYNVFYGSLSGIIVLMIIIYIMSYIITIGIAINATYKR